MLVQHYSRDADGLCTQLNAACPKTDLPSIVRLPCKKEFKDKWELGHNFIKLERQLSLGEVSEVWEGLYNGMTPCTVKALLPGRI